MSNLGNNLVSNDDTDDTDDPDYVITSKRKKKQLGPKCKKSRIDTSFESNNFPASDGASTTSFGPQVLDSDGPLTTSFGPQVLDSDRSPETGEFSEGSEGSEGEEEEEVPEDSDSGSPISEEISEDLDEFLDEAWFFTLSEEEKNHYVEKMKKLKTYKEKIPSMRDIMDLEINPESIKMLILEKKRLDTYDKLSPLYEDACFKFLKKFNYVVSNDNTDIQDQLKKIEENLKNNDRYVVPMRDRILSSHYDEQTKALIYNRYITFVCGDDTDLTKHLAWIETVLSIPSKPKEIKIDQSLPRNQAITKMASEMMDKFNTRVYGMEEAKEELVCIVSSMISNPMTKNKAIGLYGPPGIGKTLVANVMSEVLGLPMVQISLGGVTESNFLEGYNFTYLSSEPGCIAKAIIRMNCTNGIIFLDELDKISKAHKGKEVEHALLHITDSTQNHDFRDKYMPEIPINLSDIIFVYSMNTIEELDSALASRIPIVKFQGYNTKQKIDIVKRYLMPELLANYGMSISDILIGDDTIQYLISVVREEDALDHRSGVRGLKKALTKILNRINFCRIASVNGRINFKLSFEIDHFELPYTIDLKLVEKIIAVEKRCKEHQSLYL